MSHKVMGYSKRFSGYTIIGHTLFNIRNNKVIDYWPLENSDIDRMVEEAKKIVGSFKTIYYDKKGLYSEAYTIDYMYLLQEDGACCNFD